MLHYAVIGAREKLVPNIDLRIVDRRRDIVEHRGSTPGVKERRLL